MNAYRAFKDANQVSGNKIVHVARLETANSVWLCSDEKEPLYVIKYFSNDEHGDFHFKIEKNLIAMNQDKRFIPKLIHYDEKRKWIFTRYIRNFNESDISIGDILSVINEDFQEISLPLEAHKFPPGILGSDSKNGNFNLAQNIIQAEVETLSWYPEYLQNIRKNWKKNSIIHGDMKISNLVLGENYPVIFDWENVSTGSIEWDQVSILQSVIAESFGSREISFWAKKNLEETLNRIVSLDEFAKKCFSIRCVQSAFEFSSTYDRIPRLAVNMLQIADYVALNEYSKILGIAKYAS